VFDHKINELKHGSEAATDVMDIRMGVLRDSAEAIRKELAERAKKDPEAAKAAEEEEKAPADDSAAPTAGESEEHKKAREDYEAALKEYEEKERAAAESSRTVRQYTTALQDLQEMAESLEEGRKIYNEKSARLTQDVRERFAAKAMPEGAEKLGTQVQITEGFTKISREDEQKRRETEAEIDKVIKARYAADQAERTRTETRKLRVRSLDEYRRMEQEAEQARADAFVYCRDKDEQKWLNDSDRHYFAANQDWADKSWNPGRLGIHEFAKAAKVYEEDFQAARKAPDVNTEAGRKRLAAAAMNRYRSKLALQLTEKQNIKLAIEEENDKRKEARKKEAAQKKELGEKADQAFLNEQYAQELQSASRAVNFAGLKYLATHMANSALKGASSMLQDAVTTTTEAQIKAAAREMESKLKQLRKDREDVEKSINATARMNGTQLTVAKGNTPSQNLQDPELLKGISQNAATLSRLVSERERIDAEIAETEEKLAARRIEEKKELEEAEHTFREKLGFNRDSVADKSRSAAIENIARGEAVVKMQEEGKISREMTDTLLRSVNLSQSSAMSAEAMQLHALHDQDETIRRINDVSSVLSACFTEKGKDRIDMLVEGAKALRNLADMVANTAAAGGLEFELPDEIDIKAGLDSALDTLNSTITRLKGKDGTKTEHTVDELVEMAEAWQQALNTFQQSFDRMEEESHRRYDNNRRLKESAERRLDEFAGQDRLDAPEFTDEQAQLQSRRVNEIADRQIEAYRLAARSVQADLDKVKPIEEEKAREAEEAKKKLDEARASLKAVEDKELPAKEVSKEAEEEAEETA
ncbi:MAG: hypothetical protein IK115_14500, partial [Lachnospiraceae bacterium]|nr:hypothetical protein [Lachnospiraceae bacterium]